ncbi:MAG: hypothetical protein ACRD04_12820 [Terriglobales bacterium]
MPPSPSELSRRGFARSVLGGAAALALAGVATAVPLPAAAAAVPPQDESEAVVARILAAYGARLNPAQKTRLPRLVGQHLSMLAPIRARRQSNSDAPAAVLRLVTGA